MQQSTPRFYNDKTEEVLKLSQWLLKHNHQLNVALFSTSYDFINEDLVTSLGRINDYGYGSIAGAFFSKFIYHDWHDELLPEVDVTDTSIAVNKEGCNISIADKLRNVQFWKMKRGLDFYAIDLKSGNPISMGLIGKHFIGQIDDFALSENLPYPWYISMLDASVEQRTKDSIIRIWSAQITDSALERYIHLASHHLSWGPPDSWKQIVHEATCHGCSEPNEQGVLTTQFEARLTQPDEGPGLPCIELTISTNSASCQGILQLYRDSAWKCWQHRLWDGRKGLQRRRRGSREIMIRSWALYMLSQYAGLTLRASMHGWNSIAPEAFRMKVGTGPIVADDPIASRERNQAREMAARLRGYLANPGYLRMP